MWHGMHYWIVFALALVFIALAGAAGPKDYADGGNFTHEAAHAIAADPGGAGAGKTDACVVMVTPEGEEVWSRTYGAGKAGTAQSIIWTDTGNLLILCTFSAGGLEPETSAGIIEIDPAGGEVWNRTYGIPGASTSANAVIGVDGGGYAFVGSIASGEGETAWVVRLTESGDEVWNRSFAGAGNSTATAIVELPDGDFVFAGSTNSSGAGVADIWAVRLTSEGEEVWNGTFGGSDGDCARAVISATDGSILIAGTLTERPCSEPDNQEEDRSLSGMVWYDLNADGNRDPGEPGIPGIGVRLIGKRTMHDHTTTDAGGSYRFSSPPGDYAGVEFLVPDGYSCTAPGPDSDAYLQAVDVAFAESKTSRETLNVGFIGDYRTQTPAAAYGWVRGTTRSDNNSIVNVEVHLVDADGTPVASTHTGHHDYYGSMYLFGPLPPGEYSLSFTAPEGYTLTDPLAGASPRFRICGGDVAIRDAGLTPSPPRTTAQEPYPAGAVNETANFYPPLAQNISQRCDSAWDTSKRFSGSEGTQTHFLRSWVSTSINSGTDGRAL